MWQAAPQLAAALAGNHAMTARFTCVNLATGVNTDFPVSRGSVVATLGSRVTRTASITVDRGVTDAGLCRPQTDVLIIHTGVAGLGEVPVFTGRPVSSVDTADGDVTIACADRGDEINGAPFEQPWPSTPNGLARDEVVKLVQDIDPTWGVDITRAPNAPVPSLVWEEDRGRTIDELAAGLNCIFQGDRTGGFVLYPNPFSQTTSTAAPVATIRDGVNGALVTVKHTRSREQVHNSITVVVERTDNTAPIRVTVRDTNPASPTRWGGPFGKRNRIVKMRTPVGAANITALAQRILNQSLALARSWETSLPHYPLLDPGDVIGQWYRDELTFHVVESVRHNLDAETATQLATRELLQTDTTLTA